jgi:hypothetical protein
MTCCTVNPAVCATGAVDSAPRVTVHDVPDTAVTAIISAAVTDVAGSATWNCWLPLIAGNDADDATVHVSTVPGAGAVVPPEETVVAAWLVNSSTATGHAFTVSM